MLLHTLFPKRDAQQTARTQSIVSGVALGDVANPIHEGTQPIEGMRQRSRAWTEDEFNGAFNQVERKESHMERGEARSVKEKEDEDEADEKQPSSFERVFGFDAWLDYVTVCVVIMRLYRALYVIMDAIMAAKQDGSSKTYKNFFDVVFGFSVVAMTLDVLIVAFNRWKNTPIDINNRNKLVELAEVVASIIGTAYTDLRPTTDDDASVPANRLWTIISVAFAIGNLQMIPGVKGRSWWEGDGHSPRYLFSEPSDNPDDDNVSVCEAAGYGFLRFSHTAHAVVPFYGAMDTLRIFAIAGVNFCVDPMHNIPIAAAISTASIASSRALMYCFWSTVLPRHTPLISKSDGFSFWLNHLLLGFTSMVLYMTLDVGNIDKQYVFRDLNSTLSTLVPAAIVGLLYAAKSSEQHYVSFRRELEIRLQNGGNKPKKVADKLAQPTSADGSAVRQRLRDEPDRKVRPTFLGQHLRPVYAIKSATPVHRI